MMRLRIHTVAGLLVLGLLSGSTGAYAQLPTYTVEDLGTLDGVAPIVLAVNDEGVAVGFVQTAAGPRAVRLTDAGFAYVPGLVDAMSVARGINASGTITGQVLHNGWWQTFRHSDGTGLEIVDSLGGIGGMGFAVNSFGHIAGTSWIEENAALHAFRTSGSLEPEDLGTLGGASALGCGINDAGQVAGQSVNADLYTRVFRYTDGEGMVELPTLGGAYGGGCGLNEAGEVAGRADTADGQSHAFRWDETFGTVDLDTLGNTFSHAEAINDAGQIVGYMMQPSGSRAFLHLSDFGMVDLNTLVENGSAWMLTTAVAINNTGQIVGQGVHDGHARPYRLTPTSGDSEPPHVEAAWADPDVLWPPDDRMVPVGVRVDVTDNIDPMPHCRITGVTINEPASGSDVSITGDLTVQLRASRHGGGSGRVYRIDLTCSDQAGNEAPGAAHVRVPHDQGNAKTASASANSKRSR